MDNRSGRGRAGEELVVITKAYDLAREMTQRVRKLPCGWEICMARIPSVFRLNTYFAGRPHAIAR